MFISGKPNDTDSITLRLVVRGKNENDQVKAFRKGFIQNWALSWVLKNGECICHSFAYKSTTLLNVWGVLKCVFSGKKKRPTSQSTDYLHANWHDVHWQMTLSIKCPHLEFFIWRKLDRDEVIVSVVVSRDVLFAAWPSRLL